MAKEIKVPVERLSGFTIDESGCWLWPNTNSALGYGQIGYAHQKFEYAHRVFYHFLKGDLTEGMTIDHLCRNRGCVNPDHLEQVTPAENKRRGFGPAAIQARKTECKQGHPLTDKGNGHRYCRPCHLDYMRQYNRRLANG